MKQIKKWIPAIILIGLVTAVYLSPLKEYLSFETIQNSRDDLMAIHKSYPVLSPLAFILGYTASTALSLPLGTVLAILGGFIFGPYLGLIYVLAGATLGASIIFKIAEVSIPKALEAKAGQLYKKIGKEFEENVVSYMLFLRLVPLFPFMLVNILPAMFHIPLRTYVWTSFIGMLPGTFAHTYLGDALGEIKADESIISNQLIIALCLLGAFALLPILYKKFKKDPKNA